MKCDKCGYNTNPGDQICINCGAKLSLDNSMISFDKELGLENKKNGISVSALVCIIVGVILVLAIIGFLVFNFIKM